jgi:hypothetical protein
MSERISREELSGWVAEVSEALGLANPLIEEEYRPPDLPKGWTLTPLDNVLRLRVPSGDCLYIDGNLVDTTLILAHALDALGGGR